MRRNGIRCILTLPIEQAGVNKRRLEMLNKE